MGTEFMEMIERVRGTKLSSEEKDIFIRLKDELRCGDEDALWQLIGVLEYQKSFYLELPKKISEQTEKICKDIGALAENEIALAQGRLAKSVAEQAAKLSIKTRLSTLVLLGLIVLVVFFLICSLMMWSGYRIGTGGNHLPELMFRMPSGLMIGLLLLGCAGVLSYWAAKEYADEKKSLWKPLSGAIAATLLGGWVFTISF